MTHESPMFLPSPIAFDKAIIMPAVESPAPPSPPPEQVRAVETVFAEKQAESATVAGLLGLWTGTMLLHDLAIENFTPAAGELEEEELKRKKNRSEEPEND